MDTDTSDRLDLVIIGAGLSGICALIKAHQVLPEAKIAVFEKGEHVGGTWAKNSYPGLSCDIPSQLYSFSFALNPDWSDIYASQAEILQYIEGVVSSFGCTEHIHLSQECTKAEWLRDENLWRLTFVDNDSGRRYIKNSLFLITAVGFCDTPNDTSDIAGIESFQGRVFHSANWDHTVDFQDKNIVVVGNGCSANQFVPHLVNKGSIRSLVQLARSPHWIAPKTNKRVPRWQRWLFRHLPGSQKLLRFWLWTKYDMGFAAFKLNKIGKMLRNRQQKSLQDYMEATAPAKYHKAVMPDYNFGAKRPVLDHGYLSVLNSPKMELVQAASLAITDSGEVMIDNGKNLEADVIILANGFKTQELLTQMDILGRDDARLPGDWHKDGSYASAYMGVCVSGFPNLFLLTGPNTLPSGHSTLAGIECSVVYIMRLISHVLENCVPPQRARIEVKLRAQTAYDEWIQAKMQNLVYTAGVRTWYIDTRTGRNTLIWPGSQFKFWWSRCIKKPTWDDFHVE